METEQIKMLVEVVKSLTESNRLSADVHEKTDAVNRRITIALIVSNIALLIVSIYAITY